MQIATPVCPQGKQCFFLCITPKCLSRPYMCHDQQCNCHTTHSKCKQNTNWKAFNQKIVSNLEKERPQATAYITQVQQLYQKILNDIKQNYESFKQRAPLIGLTEKQIKLRELIKQSKFEVVTADDLSCLQMSLKSSNFLISLESTNINRYIDSLLIELAKLKNPETQLRYESKIPFEENILLNFFKPRFVKSLQLLYRASENEFSVERFHQLCDNRGPTVTIVLTEYGKVIGGYTPINWDKKIGNFVSDPKKQSFLFSLTENLKLKVCQNAQKQIYCSADYGPTFGDDLCIGERANKNTYSTCKVGFTYNNGNFIYQSQESYTKFSGQRLGYEFKIAQWEVFKIELSPIATQQKLCLIY